MQTENSMSGRQGGGEEGRGDGGSGDGGGVGGAASRDHADLWQEAGIMLMTEELNKAMFPIRLKDISDSKKSFNQVFRCTVPAK